jgi:hypothetical protein
MKKQLILFVAVLTFLAACQQAPKVIIASTGPQVDDLNKAMAAYASGDWETYKSGFADTAKIFFNTLQFDVDSLVRYQQARRAYYDKVETSSDAVEYIKYDNGDEWVHWWGKLKLTIKGTGRVVEVPIHLAGHLMGSKTVEQFAYFNALEISDAIKESLTPTPPASK